MANINDVFPSKFLRAADLGHATPVVTIDRAPIEVVGEDRRIVVYFTGKDKGLVLNKTNANAIADIVGSEDTDDWSGKRIKLVKAKVDYQGKRVDAIRVEEAPRASEPMTRVSAPPQRFEPPVDDDITF